MKKLLCVLLSVVLVFTAVPLVMAQGSDEMCFAVASDLHYNKPREELSHDIDDPIFWYANRRAAMEDESGFIIDEFLKECAQNSSVEFVLISGDLVDNGRSYREDHVTVAEKLKAFEQETGKQVYVIDGNHDCGDNSSTTIEDFKAVYADFGYSEALETMEGTGSYTANLGEKYRLIALDSCDQNKSTEDGLTKERVNWVLAQAKKASDDGRYPILMMHHNLLDHMPLQRIFSHDFIIRNHKATAAKFADSGIKLVLTGHEHCSDAAEYTSLKGNKIYDFATTSLTMYPLAYRIFNVSDNEIKYEAKNIEQIDYDALMQACPELTDEQIALMKADLTQYSKDFLKKGVEYRLWLGLTMEKIGIAEGEAFYNLVNTAVGGLNKILEMPLYGENSVQELAKGFNIDIPDSDYENGWDLATDLVAAHYEGSEDYALDSTEVTILLRTVDLILLDDLSSVNDEVFLKAANTVLENLGISGLSKGFTKTLTEVFGPVTAGEYFLLAIASPILYVFANDDAVDDNNGSIEGYAKEADKGANVLAKLSGILEKIVQYVGYFFNYILKIFVK